MGKATRYTQEMIKEYVGKGFWEDKTLSYYWDRNAEICPDKEAIVDSKTRLTWTQAKTYIDRLGLGFADLGIKRDEIIVLLLPPMVEAFLIRVACEKAGILCLPAARTFRHREVVHILNNTTPAGIVVCAEFADFDYLEMLREIRPLVHELRHIFVIDGALEEGMISIKDMMERPLERSMSVDSLKSRTFSPFETSLVVHTTGTTGLPKLVEHAMCSRLLHGRAYIEPMKLTEDDVFGMFAPVAAGPNGPVFFAAPQISAKVAILERWEPEAALRLIEREGITAGLLVPTQLITLVSHPRFKDHDLSSLRFVWTAGAPIPYHQAVEVEEKLGCPLLQHYGSVDADISTLTPLDSPKESRLLTVGKPMAGCEIRLFDENGKEVPEGEVGEVWGRGPTCGPGYYGDEESTWKSWEGGWFKMGDLAKWDAEGNLVIVGRKKDVIIRGGQNIYPAEIEDILRSHPKVKDAAIAGMPDPIMGQRCCAFVVLREGRDFAFEEMISFLSEKKFAKYKLPERLEVIDEMPMVGDMQKIDKKVLEQKIEDKLKAEGKL